MRLSYLAGMRTRLLLVIVLAALAAGSLTAAPASASDVPTPSTSLPPDGIRGHALWDSYYDLEPFGYEEQEWFVSGTAEDATGAEADYTTRIIVTRPADADDFNGTVLLDWTNVTAQFENAVDTMEAREMLMREGFAYVHVSAQAAGVCCTPLTPKTWDPVRYAELNHPGDAYANDMFTQIAKAVREGEPMAGYQVDDLIAAGQSQSGSKLYQYVNAYLPTHPEAVGLIEGVLVHGSASGTKGFAQPLPSNVKVLHLLSDQEANASAVQPEPNYRLWEIAGTAHSDFFIGYQSEVGSTGRVVASRPKLTEREYREVIRAAGNYGEQPHPMHATCVLAGATMPMHYAASAAIHALNEWIGGGAAPAHGPRFEFENGALARDADGNALGGVRLPPIEVPVASYRSTQCPLGGVTVPFTNAELRRRYPTFEEYRSQMAAATAASVADGFMLQDDADDLMNRVNAAQGRWATPI